MDIVISITASVPDDFNISAVKNFLQNLKNSHPIFNVTLVTNIQEVFK